MFEDKNLEYLEAYKEGMLAGIDIVIRCLRKTIPKAIDDFEADIKMRMAPVEGEHLN